MGAQARTSGRSAPHLLDLAGMETRSDPSGSASLTVGAVTAPRPAGDRLGGWIGLAVASAAHVAALLAFAAGGTDLEDYDRQSQ
jgi:hypothetical protein